jgi:hypothetical protein
VVQQKKGTALREANKLPEVRAKRSAAQVTRRALERAALSPEVLEERKRRKRQAKTERQRRNRASKREGAAHA